MLSKKVQVKPAAAPSGEAAKASQSLAKAWNLSQANPMPVSKETADGEVTEELWELARSLGVVFGIVHIASN